eukprot:3396291-Pyramimonas_sp.AAC.1
MKGGAPGYVAAPPPAPLLSETAAPMQDRGPLEGARPKRGQPSTKKGPDLVSLDAPDEETPPPPPP